MNTTNQHLEDATAMARQCNAPPHTSALETYKWLAVVCYLVGHFACVLVLLTAAILATVARNQPKHKNR